MEGAGLRVISLARRAVPALLHSIPLPQIFAQPGGLMPMPQRRLVEVDRITNFGPFPKGAGAAFRLLSSVRTITRLKTDWRFPRRFTPSPSFKIGASTGQSRPRIFWWRREKPLAALLPASSKMAPWRRMLSTEKTAAQAHHLQSLGRSALTARLLRAITNFSV